MKNRKLFFRGNKGSVIGEAAIVIPLMLVITFGITEFGNIFFIKNKLSQLARAISRNASVSQNYNNADLLTQVNASALIDTSMLTFNISPTAGASRNIGDTITVTLSYSYDPVINPLRVIDSMATWISSINSSAAARSEVRQYP